MIQRSWFTFLLGSLFLWTGQAEGAAWSQKKGHYYAKLSGLVYTADEVFDSNGIRHANV